MRVTKLTQPSRFVGVWLDPDVDAWVRQEKAANGQSIKFLVNKALRLLSAGTPPGSPMATNSALVKGGGQ